MPALLLLLEPCARGAAQRDILGTLAEDPTDRLAVPAVAREGKLAARANIRAAPRVRPEDTAHMLRNLAPVAGSHTLAARSQAARSQAARSQAAGHSKNAARHEARSGVGE